MANSANAQVWANNLAGGTQLWGTGTNWIGGVPPTSSIDTSLTFNYNFSSTAQTAQNNIGAGTFNLNSLTMNNESAGGLTISALAAANTITFNTSSGAVGPQLINNSSIAATISAGLVLANNTSVSGAGVGGLTLSGIISGAGGLTIGTSGPGIVALNGANTFLGGTTINSGEVITSVATGLGPAASLVTINGGRLRLSAAATLSQNYLLNSTFNITGAFAPTFSGSINGSGGISYRPTASATVTFTGSNGFTGAYQPLAFGNSVPSTTLSGNGAFTGVSSITLNANQTMLLDNATTNNTNRINDGATLSLMRAGLQLNGNAAAATTETIGATTFSGSVALSAVPNAAQNTTMTLASLTRNNRGSLVLTGTNMGTAGGANTSNIIVTAPSITGDLVGGGGLAGSTNISILPYAYASNTVGTASGQLVTYDVATGFRPLAANEYVTSLLGSRTTTSNNNFKSLGATAMKGSTTVNAFALDSASAAGVGSGLYGSGSVNATSGTVMFSISGGATISTLPSIIAATGGLNFGSAEGVVNSQNFSAITSSISGSNGLTKAGFSALFLMGNNTYTGDTTIDGSIVHAMNDAALGNAANNLVLAGGNVSGLNFGGGSALFGVGVNAQTFSTSRSITLADAGGGISEPLVNGSLTVSGVISGNGRLLTGTSLLGNTGVVRLTNANTYTGQTVIFGNVAITSDAALGTNSDVVATGGFLRSDGPVTSSRNFTMSGSLPLITNGFDMTLNGTFSNQAATPGTLSKGGTGTVTLTGNSQFNGTVQVGIAGPLGDMDHLETGGTLVLGGANGALAAAPTLNILSGATLRLDNTAANNNNRIAGNVNVAGGTFEVRGNSGAATTETIGTLTAGNFSPAVGNGAGIVQLAADPAQSLVVTASNFARTGAGAMLVRGNNLGGSIGPGTANLVLNTVTLTNNIITGMVGDTSLSGNGTGFVTHAAGTGVRLLTAGEYSTDTLGATLNSDLTLLNIVGAATTANSIRISAGGGIDATGQTLTVGTGMVLATGGANLGITGGTLAFGTAPATIWANDNLAVSSIMTGTGGLHKAGTGNMTLNTAATLTGGAIVSNGRLTFGVANALGTANAITVGTTDGAVGTLDLNGFNGQFAGLGGFGKVELGGANLSTTGTAQFNGELRGSGNLVVGVGAASGTQTLTGISTFAGQVRVTNGTLNLGANQPVGGNGGLGAAGNTVVLGDAPSATTFGTFTTLNNVSAVAADFTVNGAAIAADAGTSGISSVLNANPIYSGNITVNRLMRLGGSTPSSGGTGNFAGGNIYTGNISDGSLVGGIDFFNGSHSLWGNNTFSGGLFMNAVSGAYLGLGSNTALGTGFLKITSFSGNLRADNGARTIGNNTYFTSATATTLGIVGVNDFTFSGNWDLGGGDFVAQTPVSVAGPRTLNVLNNLTTMSGVISGTATATLTKGGGGTLVMSGLNTFAGNVTVNQGSLLVNGTNSGAGAYTVNNGALLGGSGTIAGPVTINALAALEPGNSAGTISTGALTLATGSLLMWELGDSTVPTASDLAAVTGNLSVAGGTGTVTLNLGFLTGFGLQPGATTWTIMTYTGTLTGAPANFVIGQLPGFITGATIDTTTTPGSVLLVLVPSPSGAGVLAMAGLLAARRRRRS